MPWASSRSSSTARRSSASASSRRVAPAILSLPSRERGSQRERQPDEPLLRAVVEVALEPPALGVARLDDAGARSAQMLELRARFGLEALVLDREPGRRGDLLDQLGVVEQVRAVEDTATGPPSRTSGVALGRPRPRRRPADRARRPSGPRRPGRRSRAPGRPAPSASASRRPPGRRLAQLDDEPRERRARAASPHAPRDRARRPPSGGLSEPEQPLERVVPRTPARGSSRTSRRRARGSTAGEAPVRRRAASTC